ncbi:hypothetical protein Bca101_039045 [Brassica carinata]
MESKKSSHAGASFLLISTIFLFFLSRQASSYQMLICSGLSTSACSECKAECESTYGALCIQENSKSDRIYCCCKKSPPPSYYGPIEAPSS